MSKKYPNGKDTNTGLTAKQAIFVDELEKHGLPKRAAEAAGYADPTCAAAKLRNHKLFPTVAAACDRALERRKGAGIKTSDDVLRYIHTTMFFNPLKFFEPSDGGGWLVDERDWRDLPDEIGCLIESVELRTQRVETLAGVVETRKVWVKLVSKTQAMMLAARHQLGDKHAVSIQAANSVDWEDLARRGSMVTRGSELEAMVQETEISVERMREVEQGLEKAPLVVTYELGKKVEDCE